jgi:long-chain fatty acid transport protein
MKTLKLTLLTAIVLSVFTSSLLAGGFALSGIGSRAISMGGAFRGMADDPSAMYWNPAGLGFMDTNVANLSVAGIYPGSTYNQAMYTAGKDVEASKKLWLFPNIYAIKGGECKLHYGLGVYVPYGLGAEWDIFDTSAYSVLDENEIYSSIGIVDIHPTASYLINENLSVGAGLSVQYGMISIRKLIQAPTSTTSMELNGAGLGFGGNFGVLYKLTPSLNIGLSGKIPSTVTLKGDTEFTVISDAGVTTMKPDAEADLKLPAEVGLGFSYKVKPNWVVNLDLSHTMWDSMDEVVIDLEDPYTDPVMNTAWENISRASLGTEYWINPANALRCGFFFDQSPIPDESLNPAFPDISDKMSGNIGYSKVFGPMQLDMNVEYIHFNEREIDVQTTDNLVGTYNTSVFAGNMGITYKF